MLNYMRRADLRKDGWRESEGEGGESKRIQGMRKVNVK